MDLSTPTLGSETECMVRKETFLEETDETRGMWWM